MLGNLNPLQAVKSRPALFLAAALVVLMLTGLLAAFHPQAPTQNSKLYTNFVYDPTVSVERQVPHATRMPATFEMAPAVAATNRGKPLPPLSIHVELPMDTNPPPLSVYAPVGRLIQCQLVNTVDSGASDAPIIALVTEDLWHDGNLVIPAGSEAHGRAQSDTLRERIISSGTWVIVKKTGEELVLNGIALDREHNEKTGTWGITDGSPGLAGDLIQSKAAAEIKVLGATLLSGVASAMQQSQATVLGTQISATGRNVALTGASQVLNTYAQQNLDAIKKDSVYVRVPAGKQFYLYVTQTIDLSKAKIGNMRAEYRPAQTNGTTHLTKP